MMRKLTKREKFFFCLFVAAGVIFIGYRFCVYPLMKTSGRQGGAVRSKYISLRKKIRSLETLAQLRNDYNLLEEKFEQDGSSEQVISSIISEIESVAGKLNLKISDLKPRKVKEDLYVNRFSVSLTLDSTFDEIIEFLRVLQQDPYRFNVDEFRIDKGSRRKSSTLKVRLIIGKFFIHEL